MVDAAEITRSRRLPFWVVIVALTVCVIGGVFSLLWFKLPTWAPEWVVEHSPWVDPIVRAVEQDGSAFDQAWKRLAGRGGPVAWAMIPYLETERKGAVTLTCRVLREVVNPDMIVPAMRRLRSGVGHGADLFDLGNLVEALSKQQADLVVDALLPIPQAKGESSLLMIALAGRLADQRAVDALRAIIWEPAEPTGNVMEESFGRSSSAVASLVNSPVSSAVPLVLSALEDRAAHVRLRAVSGLTSPVARKPLSPEILLALSYRLTDHDETVKGAAAVAASFNPIPGAEAELIDWLGSSDAKERSLGLTGLGAKHASQMVIGAIAKCLHDPEPKVRRAAIRALDRTANPLVVPFLLESYPTMPSEEKREIIGVFRSKDLNRQSQVFPFILSVMGDSDLKLAQAAERIIWKIVRTDEQQASAESARNALFKRQMSDVAPASP